MPTNLIAKPPTHEQLQSFTLTPSQLNSLLNLRFKANFSRPAFSSVIALLCDLLLRSKSNTFSVIDLRRDLLEHNDYVFKIINISGRMVGCYDYERVKENLCVFYQTPCIDDPAIIKAYEFLIRDCLMVMSHIGPLTWERESW